MLRWSTKFNNKHDHNNLLDFVLWVECSGFPFSVLFLCIRPIWSVLLFDYF